MTKRQISTFLAQPLRSITRRARGHRPKGFRERESLGLIHRPNYAYGMLRAADLARFMGKKKATVCEFGVATGDGLMNMVDIAALIRIETQIELTVVGLDTGQGLPVVDGYKDHPELWSMGDFPMTNKDQLRRRVSGKADLIFGDIRDTVDSFVSSLDASSPLAFVSIDVDIYSGAKSALKSLLGKPELYTPAVSVYCDDVQFLFANKWCGELRAIDEFNEENELRKIDQDRSLPGHRKDLNAPWHRSMFVCHLFDHDLRSESRNRAGLSLNEHFSFMKNAALF